MKNWKQLGLVAGLAAVALVASVAMLAAQARVISVVATEFAYEPAAMTVEAGEEISITLTNAGNAPHDITFELDGGRVVETEVIRNGETDSVGFVAPAVGGEYVFYCSVGEHRQRGMEGILTVTAGPAEFEVVVGDLDSPRGLHVAGSDLYVSEGGTGAPGDGFVPGNLDGRVIKLSLSNPLSRTVVITGMGNAVDPGGGVIGANHALPDPESPLKTLVALSGGPGHPDPKAQLLTVSPTGEALVALDMWAYEEANNPDGGEIDSNPWRIATGAGSVYISDAGANTVLRLGEGCPTGCTFAVLEPVGEDDAGEPISAVPTGLAWDSGEGALYVSLLASFAEGEAQVRRLEDMTGDGDALDDGENTVVLDGLTMAVDIARDPSGRLWAIEFGGFAAQGRLIEVTEAGPGVIVEGLHAPSGLAFTAGGDALVAVGLEGTGFTTSQVVRVPASLLKPLTPTATPTPTEPPTPEGSIFLPWTYRP